MINIGNVSNFCKDDISLIENYEEAVNSTEPYDCHHRLEIDLNLSRKELKDRNLYFNRPASELIFLTHKEHTRLHKTGENNPLYGKSIKDFMSSEVHNKWLKKCSRSPKNRMSSEVYQLWREHLKGENNPKRSNPAHNKGKRGIFKWMNDTIEEHYVHKDYWGEFIDIGFTFGRLYLL